LNFKEFSKKLSEFAASCVYEERRRAQEIEVEASLFGVWKNGKTWLYNYPCQQACLISNGVKFS
jgi:hypothetical protein